MKAVDKLIEKVKRIWRDDNGVWHPLVDQNLLDALVLLRGLQEKLRKTGDEKP